MKQFEKFGFVIERGIVENPQAYALKCKEHESEAKEDEQCPGSPAIYRLKDLDGLHELLRQRLELITGLELYKTYHYFRFYHRGAKLDPHFDRESCEVSITLNLSGDPWEIGCFDNYNYPHQVILNPGDGLIYHGIKLCHWRPGCFQGNELIQIFLHYVDKNGPYSYCKDDKFQ